MNHNEKKILKNIEIKIIFQLVLVPGTLENTGSVTKLFFRHDVTFKSRVLPKITNNAD